MIECIAAWILIIIAFVQWEPMCFLAAGVFAIATNINQMK